MPFARRSDRAKSNELEMRCARRRVRFVTKRRKKCAGTQRRSKRARAYPRVRIYGTCVYTRANCISDAALKPRRASSLRRMCVHIRATLVKSQVSRINLLPNHVTTIHPGSNDHRSRSTSTRIKTPYSVASSLI